MEPGQLLFSLLSQAPDVAALVGYVEKGVTKYRIYPLRIEAEQMLPALTYQVISNSNDSTATCELNDQVRVQINAFTKTYSELATLAAAVRAALTHQRVGDYAIDYDGYRDQYADAAICYFRSIDFLLE